MTYNFAPLGSVLRQIKSSLKECGLSYRWETDNENEKIKITCIVSHLDGHSERNPMSADKDATGNKNPIQQQGSTMTYLQRYTLLGALGIGTADEDTDAKETKKPKQTAKVELVPITEENFKNAVKYVKQYSIDSLKKRYSFNEKMENKLKEAAIDGI